jgi:hypothetical protein
MSIDRLTNDPTSCEASPVTGAFWSATLLLLVCVACTQKEEIGRIHGQLTYGDATVTDATLFFRDYDRGIHVMAEVDQQGGYQVFTAGGKGLPLGEYLVCVIANEPTVEADPETGRITRPASHNKAREDIPSRYRDAKTTPLRVVVASGDNQFDIEMTD